MTDNFTPRELKTIEVDVEKKVFKVNGEEFGKNCTGFTISCDGCDSFNVRMEIGTVVHFGRYQGSDRISVSEHPVIASWYSEGEESGDESK